MKDQCQQNLLAAALVGMVALGNGCGTQNDAVSQAGKSEQNAPGIAETKDIAEQGFIYGLPLVMNYAVMYSGFVDKHSRQYKTTFNQLYNESRVFTYQDTAVVTPNSDTPYSFVCADLRAEPLVISVPAVPKERYFSVQFCDGNTFNYGYIGSRATGNEAGDYLLPAPDGPIYLVMRLYLPKTEAPSILPPGEGTWKPPGVVVAN
jgi:hypothetical protein